MYYLKISFRVLMLMVVLVTLSIGIRSATAATAAQGKPASSCGIWHVAPGPNVRSVNNNLRAVATVSSGDMWAVGSTYSNHILSPSSTLTDHWNGTRWSIVPSPNAGSASNFLSAVAAVSSNDVWAVGSYYIDDRGSAGKTLIEHWNGTTWSIVPSPNVGSSFNQLDGVAVVSASDVWAVGNYIGQNPAKTLIEHWNGTRWSVVPSPSPGASNNGLDQVTVVSANDIWTVGSFSVTNGNDQTLAEHWNGTSWNVVASPNVGRYSNYLRGVAAVSSQDVWAVGYSSGQVDSTLIEHWNGSNWSVVPSPNPETSSNALSGVAIVSSSDVWAVGSDSDISTPSTTLVEHWNGSNWMAVPSRNRPPASDGLLAVTVASANDIWAVGFHLLPDLTFQTLFEHGC